MNKLLRNKRYRGDMIFYWFIAIVPCIQFCLMWGGTNINNILLAFKTWDYDLGDYVWLPNNRLFENFWLNIKDFMGKGTDKLTKITPQTIQNSFLAWGVPLLIGLPFTLSYSFYVHKKLAGTKIFRTILYIPAIVSSVVMTTMFMYFVEKLIPSLIPALKGEGLISNPKTAFPTLIFYSMIFSFGSGSVIYSSTMDSVNPSMVEAAQLDGCNSLQEFIYIYFPMCFNLIKLSLIGCFTGILGAELGLYVFFGQYADARLHTIGYTRTVLTMHYSRVYPYLAAYSLMCMALFTPLVILNKRFLDKFDPFMEEKVSKPKKIKKAKKKEAEPV